MRPEYLPARQVPVPQPATPAVERSIDARAHCLIDGVGFARAGGLPMESKAEDEHDETGRGRERHGQRRVGGPGGEPAPRACRIASSPLLAGRLRTLPKARVPSASGISSTPGRRAERRQRLRWAEHIDQFAADNTGLEWEGGSDGAVARCHQDWRTAATIVPSPFATSTWRPAIAPNSA